MQNSKNVQGLCTELPGLIKTQSNILNILFQLNLGATGD